MGKPRPTLERSFSTIKRQFHWRKSIRPFISSTFLDFQEERGHLLRNVYPQLNSVCHARGTYFAPVDLRWGINEEQSQSGNVISLCLEYVNRCSPFFICLIGERYGTHRPSNAPLLPASLDKLPKDASWLDKNYLVAASKGHEWILQEAYQYCSVTELEIIQAAILNDNRFCRFYVRDVRHTEDKFTDLPEEERQEKLKIYKAESEETEMRVTALKHRIINKGLKIQFYRTPEELGDKVLEDWMEVFNELYPPLDELNSDVDGEQFREWAAHESFAETRRRVFVQTPEIQKLYAKITDHCEACLDPDTPSTAQQTEWTVVKSKNKNREEVTNPKSIITLIGERGCGKTALVANWVKQFQSSSPGFKVLAHYVGSSALSTDISSFLRRVTFELRGEYAGDNPSECNGDSEELSNFHRICEAFVAAIAMGPFVLVLDGLDELGNTTGMGMHQVKEMKWLPATLPPQCKIIVSSVRSDLTYKSLANRRDNETLTIPLFNNTADKAAVVERHLAMHCKCLDASHLKKIVNCKMSSRPMFLTILSSELRVCGTFSNLSELLDRYVGAPSFRDLWKCVISRWTQDYGWSTEERLSASSFAQIDALTGWVAETLRLLACSRHGLSESDILTLLKQMGYRGQSKVSRFDFALFRSAAFDALVERPGGLLGFFHQDLKDAVFNSLLGVIPGLNSELAASSGVNFLPQVLNGQMQQCHEHLAEFFQHQPASRRRVEELPYHLDRCGNVNGLNKVVTDPDVFLAMQADTSQNIALKLDLLHYCHRLVKENFNVTTSLTKMVTNAIDREDNPGKVTSPSKVSFAGDIQEVVMQTNTQMDWALPDFKKGASKNDGSDFGSDDLSKNPFHALEDLTAFKPPRAVNENLSEEDQLTNDFTNSIDDRASPGSQITVNESVEESLAGDPQLPKDLTASQVAETNAKPISDNQSTDEQALTDLMDSMEDFSLGDGGSGENTVMASEPGKSKVREASDDIAMNLASIGGDEQEMLDDLVKTLGDAEKYDDDDDKKKVGSENVEAGQEEDEMDETKVRCKGALLAMQVGKFLAEKSEFEQAEEMLMLAYDRIIENFPLTDQEQLLFVQVQESIGERHLFQLRKAEARLFFGKALGTLKHVIEEEAFDNDKPLLETKGRLLIRLGSMAVHDQIIKEAECYLLEASQCMKRSHSVAGIATAQFNLGLLKIRKNDYAAATACLREALQTRERWYGSSHPLVAEVLNELAGLTCRNNNMYGYNRIKAEAYYRRALKIREESLGEDHLLVATTLYHLGKLLRNDGSYQSKKEALSLMNRALDIRTTKFGAHHKLTYSIRNTVKSVRTELNRGDYDRAPVKQPDKRTSKNPHSNLSWRDQDLLRIEQRNRSGSLSPSRLSGSPGGRRSPKSWQSEDRSRSPKRGNDSWHSNQHGGTRHGSVQYNWESRGSRLNEPGSNRSRAQSTPLIRHGPQSNDGVHRTERPGSSASVGRGQASANRKPAGRGQASANRKPAGRGQASANRKPAGRGQASANRKPVGRGRGSGSMGPGTKNSKPACSSSSSSTSSSSNQGPTVLGSNEGESDGTPHSDRPVGGVSAHSRQESCQQTSGERPNSAVAASALQRGAKSTFSAVSHTATHTSEIASEFDSQVHGPNSQITALLGEPPCPRPKSLDAVHDAAWYHGKGRYPKDERDIYPPRRHQQRPNRHILPEATPTSRPEK